MVCDVMLLFYFFPFFSPSIPAAEAENLLSSLSLASFSGDVAMYCIVCRLIFCFVLLGLLSGCLLPFVFCLFLFLFLSRFLERKESRKERRKEVLGIWRAQLYICMYGTYVCM